MKRAWSVLGVLLLTAAGACGPAEPEFYGTTRVEVGPPEDFTLTDQYGKDSG